MDYETLLGELYAPVKSHLEKGQLTELRIRQDAPLMGEIMGQTVIFESPLGSRYIVQRKDITSIILNFCDNALYSKESQLREGYLTKNGLRLSLAGDFSPTGEIKAVTNVTSLLLRIPQKLAGTSRLFHDKIFSGSLKSVLIISPPGCGKTTFLRDLIRSCPFKENIFVSDEKGELEMEKGDLGIYVDVVRNMSKQKSFMRGIRLFAPKIIAVDEIYHEVDTMALKKAISAGIKVFATFHGRSEEDFKESNLFSLNLFQRYVILEKDKKGVVEKILDENFNPL